MPLRRLLPALLVALATLGVRADEPATEALVKQLGDDRQEMREAAQNSLLDLGVAALPKLRELLPGTESDAEQHARLKSVVARLELLEVNKEVWKTDPIERVRASVKDEKCGCGRSNPWKIEELRHEVLVRRFVNLRFYILKWGCCQDRPVAWRVIAAGPKDEELFEISNSVELREILRSRMKAVKTADEAREAADAIYGLLAIKTTFEEEFHMPEPGVVKEHKAEGWGVRVAGGYYILFDEDGLYSGIVIPVKHK